MKVALIACGPSARAFRRERPDVSEVWAINAAGLVYSHDLLFAMDDCRVQEARAVRDESIRSIVEMLEVHPRFFTSTAYPEYPGAREFPLEQVAAVLPLLYFNSTVAYAVAYAIYTGVKELHLYGVDFSYPNAHKAEKGRGCVEFLLGVAMAWGMRVVVPEESTLLDRSVPEDEKPYGYDAWRVTFDGERITKVAQPIPSAETVERRYA